MTKAVTFTAKRYSAATAKLIEASGAVDKLAGGQAKIVNAWAAISAAGIVSGALTVASVKEGLIAAHKGAETLSDCGETIKSRFYMLNRVAKADALPRLVSGEALCTVARECKPVQEQKTGKRGKKGGKGKPRAITLEAALEAVNGWLDSALGDIELAKSMAANPDIAAMLAKVGKVTAMVTKPARKSRKVA